MLFQRRSAPPARPPLTKAKLHALYDMYAPFVYEFAARMANADAEAELITIDPFRSLRGEDDALASLVTGAYHSASRSLYRSTQPVGVQSHHLSEDLVTRVNAHVRGCRPCRKWGPLAPGDPSPFRPPRVEPVTAARMWDDIALDVPDAVPVIEYVNAPPRAAPPCARAIAPQTVATAPPEGIRLLDAPPPPKESLLARLRRRAPWLALVAIMVPLVIAGVAFAGMTLPSDDGGGETSSARAQRTADPGGANAAAAVPTGEPSSDVPVTDPATAPASDEPSAARVERRVPTESDPPPLAPSGSVDRVATAQPPAFSATDATADEANSRSIDGGETQPSVTPEVAAVPAAASPAADAASPPPATPVPTVAPPPATEPTEPPAVAEPPPAEPTPSPVTDAVTPAPEAETAPAALEPGLCLVTIEVAGLTIETIIRC